MSIGILNGKKVLVAEDNQFNQMVILQTLRQVGIVADIACNGQQAIDRLETGEQYDIIIMDLQMPEMDGFEATTYIRNTLHLETPILALTANVLGDVRVQCLKSGMNEYISKPFLPAVLFHQMECLIANNPGPFVA
jgi:CheY-like chemotaxis protein